MYHDSTPKDTTNQHSHSNLMAVNPYEDNSNDNQYNLSQKIDGLVQDAGSRVEQACEEQIGMAKDANQVLFLSALFDKLI
jgi:hypothetical protein